MRSRNLRIAAVLVVIVVIVSAVTILLTRPKSESAVTYTHRGPIIIVGDTNFTSENGVVSGDGSSDHPYIIEGWEIGASNISTCIGIYDASVHVTVRKVHLNHGINGVNLFNITGGRVDHAVVENMSIGIGVIESKSVAVVGNTVRNCMVGINLLSSNNVRVDDNHFSGNELNVRKPSVPWEQSWIGDAICIAILIPLVIIIGIALYFRFFKRPEKPQELQVPLEEAPPEGTKEQSDDRHHEGK